MGANEDLAGLMYLEKIRENRNKKVKKQIIMNEEIEDIIKELKKISDVNEFIDDANDLVSEFVNETLAKNEKYHYKLTKDEVDDIFDCTGEKVKYSLTNEGGIFHDKLMDAIHNLAKEKFPDEMNWLSIDTPIIE